MMFSLVVDDVYLIDVYYYSFKVFERKITELSYETAVLKYNNIFIFNQLSKKEEVLNL